MVAGLSGWSWFGLVVYLFVMVVVIKPVRVPLGRRLSGVVRSLGVALRLVDRTEHSQPISIPLDLRTAPVSGVILLLITTAIPGSVLRAGIVGTESVTPYNVLVLFISLAYISTALDSTGGLRSLAFWIAQKSGERQPAKERRQVAQKATDSDETIQPEEEQTMATASGRKLWAILYWFWFIAGVIVGNDPIILSGTPFLCYFAEHVELSTSTAWTFAQFISANVASAALVSSNPTNILIANAFKLNYITHYTAYTILPCVITAIVAFALCFVVFTVAKPDSDSTSSERAQFIPKRLSLPEVNPRDALLDPRGAIFHSSLMAVTLVVLIGTTFVPHEAVEVWMVTAPAGIIAFAYDLVTEWHRGRKSGVTRETEGNEVVDGGGQSSIEKEERRDVGSEPIVPRPFVVERASVPALLRAFQGRFPTMTSTIQRLPLSLLLFAGGIFVLVRALTFLGWTPIFAGWLVHVAPNPASITFFLGYVIALLCPVCGTNIGATILFVEIITDPTFLQSPRVLSDPRILTAAIYSTALASNLGACGWSFSGSLAGLLWSKILEQKGTKIKERTFAGWNVWFLPGLSTTASAVIVLEVYCFPAQGGGGGGGTAVS